MNATLINIAIGILIKFLVKERVFERIKAAVERWEDSHLAGREKAAAAQNDVINDLRVLGIQSSVWIINTGIELAVAQLNLLSKKIG